METSLVFQKHPEDEIWEQYALGRLDDAQLETVEEHLLVCERCQKTLERTDQYLRLMKTAAAELAARPSSRTWKSQRFKRFPGPILVAPAAALALAAVVFWGHPGGLFSTHPAGPLETASITVRLQSLRAGNSTAMNRALSRHPLDLSVPLVATPASTHYRMEVVDRWGKVLWSGAAETDQLSVIAHVGHGFSSGTYWVRLYGDVPEVLAEYGLNLD